MPMHCNIEELYKIICCAFVGGSKVLKFIISAPNTVDASRGKIHRRCACPWEASFASTFIVCGRNKEEQRMFSSSA